MAFSIEITDGIKRYLWSVAAHLGQRSPDERAEILQEVESHLYEGLHARYGDTPSLEDLQALLAEMPRPESYADDTAGAPVPPVATLRWGDIPVQVADATRGWNYPLLLGIVCLVLAVILLFRSAMTLVILPVCGLFSPFLGTSSWGMAGLLGVWAVLVALVYLVGGVLLWTAGIALVRQARGESAGAAALNALATRLQQTLCGVCWQAVAGVACVVFSLVAFLRGGYYLYLVKNFHQIADQLQQSLGPSTLPNGQPAVTSLLQMGTAGLTFWGWFWILAGGVLAIASTRLGAVATRVLPEPAPQDIWRKLAWFARLFYPSVFIGLVLEIVLFVLFALMYQAYFPIQGRTEGVALVLLLLLASPLAIFICARIMQRKQMRETGRMSVEQTPYWLVMLLIFGILMVVTSAHLFGGIVPTIAALGLLCVVFWVLRDVSIRRQRGARDAQAKVPQSDEG